MFYLNYSIKLNLMLLNYNYNKLDLAEYFINILLDINILME